jgi:hypothetical protein
MMSLGDRLLMTMGFPLNRVLSSSSTLVGVSEK